MGGHKKKPNHQLSRWSELCPDLLRCVFKRLSFIDLDRAKFVCRWWYSTSKDCIPKPIPCVISFPPKKETNNSSETRKNSNNRCVLYVPGGDNKDSVYKTRDLGVAFAKSFCLATYGSWLLMFNYPWKIYILNILTLERIDLPRPHSIYHSTIDNPSCLWIDDITKDYLVLWSVKFCKEILFTKNGDDSWRNIDSTPFGRHYQDIVYNHKDHKVYVFIDRNHIRVWDFSGDTPSDEGYLLSFDIKIRETLGEDVITWRRCIAVTLSGQVLCVTCIRCLQEPWQFHIYRLDPDEQKWVKIDSLGDEALILDIGHTVVANDFTGIKRNSIYLYSRLHYFNGANDEILVYDLTTRTFKQQSFPSKDRWFFPGLTG